MRKWQAQAETSTLRFNMGTIATQYANVAVGCNGRSMALTVMVPALTNTVALREGEQLCLEVAPKATSTKRNV